VKYLLAILLCLPLLAYGITAKSYVVLDQNGDVILEHNADTVRPIASITKLFTAARNVELPGDADIMVSAKDIQESRMRTTPLRAGHEYTRDKLLELALVSSDNAAAKALGRTAQVGIMLPPDTTYREPSGLDPANRSTARQVAKFALSLLDTRVAELSVHPGVFVDSEYRKNTNPLIGKHGWTFLLTKTGFINEAGGCLVVVTKIKGEVRVIALLGSISVKQRWNDLAELRQKLGDTDFAWPEAKTSSKRRHR